MNAHLQLERKHCRILTICRDSLTEFFFFFLLSCDVGQWSHFFSAAAVSVSGGGSWPPAGSQADASRADKQRLCLICLQVWEVICAGQASLNLTWALNISQARKKKREKKKKRGGGEEFKATHILHFTAATRQTERWFAALNKSLVRIKLRLNLAGGLNANGRPLRAKVDEKKTYSCEFEDFLYLIL